MKYLSLLACSILWANLTVKAQNNYAADQIPENLKKDAVAVIRNEESFFDYKSPSSGHQDYKIAITILNKAGEDFAEMVEPYDQFSTLSNLKASLYDANGKKVKEYKSADFIDHSYISDYSLFEDSRIKLLKFYHVEYPYTIVYSFSKDFKGVISLPSWTDLKAYHLSVQHSAYTLQRPTGLPVHWRTSPNLNTDSVQVGDKVKYSWVSNNVEAVDQEPLSVGLTGICKKVQIAPGKFEYDGSSGNFDNWKNFGSWIFNLNQGGDKLPPNFKAIVQNLVKDAKTDKEKITMLYRYLQQNTRYVSVQLGIGGFKPILAEKVAQVNYGDCKALSNFMKAMLNEVGIAANLIVIGNGMPSLAEDFASLGQANHMIVCVPSKTDTTFLECTSQHVPMGYIGYDNADRKVLMVTPEGGKIIKTPQYLAKDNYQLRKIKVKLDDTGKADIAISTAYAFAQFEDAMHLLLMPAEEQRKTIAENINIKGAELTGFTYQQPDPQYPLIREELHFTTNQLLTLGGDKSFLTPNLVNQQKTAPQKIEQRKTSFSVNFSYLDTDEITYELPQDYAVEFLPKDILIRSEFGTYEAKFSVKDHVVTYTRKREMTAKIFPPERYNDYVDFIKKIYQADKSKVILTRKL